MHLLIALVFATQSPVPRPQPQTPDTAHVVIVATTDVHGRVLGWDYVKDEEAPGGLSRVATILETLRAQYPGQLLTVDAGDLLQGNPFAAYFATVERRRPNPVVDALNALQYDVVTPGNHDFNFGLGALARALTGARYPYVAANMVREPGGEPALDLYRMVERAGVRIGITGATTPGVHVWDGPTIRGQLRFLGVAQAVPPVVRQMRADGADVTVLLAHAGLDGPSSYADTSVPPENDVAAAIRGASELDVAIIGHTHREIPDSTVGTTLVVQPMYGAQNLAVVTLSLARRAGRWQLVRKSGALIPLALVRPDTALVSALQGAHDSARAWATRPLGQNMAAMSARTARLEDTPVIDFINEVQRRKAGAQLSAAAAFEIASALIEKFGGDSLDEMRRNYSAYMKYLKLRMEVEEAAHS